MIFVGKKNTKRLNTFIISVTFHKLIRVLTFSHSAFLLDNIFVGFSEAYESFVQPCVSLACLLSFTGSLFR